MGQAASVPTTPSLRTRKTAGSKKKSKHAGIGFTLPLKTAPKPPPFPSLAAWRPRRRSLGHLDLKKEWRSEPSKNPLRLLTSSKSNSRPTPRTVVIDDVDDVDNLEGLAIRVAGRKFSRDDPVRPPLELHQTLEALHDKLKRESMLAVPTSSRLTRTSSAPSRPGSVYETRFLAPPPRPGQPSGSPSGSPRSCWSPSSGGTPSPAVPFESFRNSLNGNQLKRLSGINFASSPSDASSPAIQSASPALPRTKSQQPSSSTRGFSLFSRRKTGSTRRNKRPIVVVEAHRVGSDRYSVMKEAADATALVKAMEEEKLVSSRASKIPFGEAKSAKRRSSNVSIDVFDTAVPFPGTTQSRVVSPLLSLSPRFSTTPIALANFYREAPENVRADARRLNRASWINLESSPRQRRRSSGDLSAFIAASPELTCATEDDEIFLRLAASPPLDMVPTPLPVASPLPASHPASFHKRFSNGSQLSLLLGDRRASHTSLLSPPCPTPRRRSSASPITFKETFVGVTPSRPGRQVSNRICFVDNDEGEAERSPQDQSRRASTFSLATTANSADQAVVSRANIVHRRSRLGSVAETAVSSPNSEFPLPFGRPSTLYSQHSGLSFPRSVGDDNDSPFASPAPLAQTPSAFATANTNSGFLSYSMATAGKRVSVTSSISPDTVDSFPSPPAVPALPPHLARIVPPARLDLSRPSHLHRSLNTNLGRNSPTTTAHASTPSSASFSSSITSESSIDVASLPDNVLRVDFSEFARVGGTFSKEEMAASPALSAGSLATFVLEDLINDLQSADWEAQLSELPESGMTARPKGRLSLEQPDLFPSLHLAPPLPLNITPRSPPQFISSFSFNPSSVTSTRKIAHQTSPASHPLNDGIFDSPFLCVPSPAPDASASTYRFPSSPGAQPHAEQSRWSTLPTWTRASAGDALFSSIVVPAPLDSRRGTFPAFVPPSQRVKERSLFDALLARSALEEEVEKKEDQSEATAVARQDRLGSADKRGFNRVEVSDWMRRVSETEVCE